MMKAIFALAAVLLLSSTPVFSQNSSEPSFSEPSIRGGQDNMSFAKAVRRRVNKNKLGCYQGACKSSQTCCEIFDSNVNVIGHKCYEGHHWFCMGPQ